MISDSKLGIGPMSKQIIRSVFSYSGKKKAPLMLISSFNQINYLGGYVTDNQEYSNTVSTLRAQYPNSEVYICRDHCGPGFSSKVTMDNLEEAVSRDLETGYDLIHLDFCHYSRNLDDILSVSKKYIDFIQESKPSAAFEIGTDENKGNDFRDPSDIKKIADFFTAFCQPEFFVVQTGSLIKEIEQVGSFNADYVNSVLPVLQSKHLKIKEHNADYLDSAELQKRRGSVSAVNNAPQFGVMQTMFTLHKAIQYGVDITDFLNVSYESHRWDKWLYKNSSDNKFLCSVIAGHYNFETDAYKKIIDAISRHENFEENLEVEIHKLIDHYLQNLI